LESCRTGFFARRQLNGLRLWEEFSPGLGCCAAKTSRAKATHQGDSCFFCEKTRAILLRTCMELHHKFIVHWKAQLYSHHFFPSIWIFTGFYIVPWALQVADHLGVSFFKARRKQKSTVGMIHPDTKNKKTNHHPSHSH